MQLSVYTQSQSVSPGSAVLVMPGAQSNLRFRTNIGLFSLGDLPTTVRISAIRQDGAVASTYDYQLNNAGHTGSFAQIPMTALPVIDGNPMTIKVQSLSGEPRGRLHRDGRPDQLGHCVHPGPTDLLENARIRLRGPRPAGPFSFRAEGDAAARVSVLQGKRPAGA